jgi:acyl-CoA reductase-like NAD-dependent aldehyde dehydrogenase
MLAAEETLAIPLWINGRAYLTVTPEFQEVRNPLSGTVLRRTPRCGALEAQHAVASAQLACATWVALSIEERTVLLSELGKLLADYAPHFAGIIAEETAKSEAEAAAEVAASVDILCQNVVPETITSGVVAVIGSAPNPLLGMLQLAVPALLKGEVLILRPCPGAPSSLFALAELSGRCEFPGGVFNVLFGDDLIVDELRLAGALLRFA